MTATAGLRYRQCSAKTRSGARCKGSAMVAMSVCRMHGGSSPQARAKAQERIALAEAMESYPARTADEILSYSLHASDVMMQQAVQATAGQTTIAPDQLANTVRAIERAQQFAKEFVTLGHAERQVRIAERTAELINGGIDWLLEALELDQVTRVRAEKLVLELLPALSAGELPALPAGGGDERSI